MLGLEIFLAHWFGDYVVQTDWMAQEKTNRWLPAIIHGITYTIAYAFITHSIWALLVICITHIVIDRYRLAKYLIWSKNQLSPKRARYPWSEGKANAGFSKNTPAWLSTWLMIIVDNGIHIIINTLAILFL